MPSNNYIYKMSNAGGMSTITRYTDMLAGNAVFVDTSYDSIATATVGSGGAASVTISSIPSTYTHLQVRILGQTNRGTYGRDGLYFRLNSDSGANYSYHYVAADGSGSAFPISAAGQDKAFLPEVTTSTAGANIFGNMVLDILDYANTSKNKTIRSLGGGDHNGTVATLGAQVSLNSGAWYSASVVNSITFYPISGTLISQYSQFALYGIRG
jgi:hypothetical protein